MTGEQDRDHHTAHDHLWYCSSLNCSIDSTAWPGRLSTMATCVTRVVCVAPCQFTPRRRPYHITRRAV